MSLEALKRNGHNLDLGRFDVAGEYDIPVIEPVHFDKNIRQKKSTAGGPCGVYIETPCKFEACRALLTHLK